jgi:hypothetical protein
LANCSDFIKKKILKFQNGRKIQYGRFSGVPAKVRRPCVTITSRIEKISLLFHFFIYDKRIIFYYIKINSLNKYLHICWFFFIIFVNFCYDDIQCALLYIPYTYIYLFSIEYKIKYPEKQIF